MVKISDHGLRGLTGSVRKNCTACWLVMHAKSASLGVLRGGERVEDKSGECVRGEAG